MGPIHPIPGESLLALGKRCGAVYVCPKVNGQRSGPLVAYAGKDATGRNLVGDMYFNFRRIEEHPAVVLAFARATYQKLCEEGLIGTFDTVCGIPQGGRTFGQMLALVAQKRFVYADKKPRHAEAGKKQEFEWDLSQFEFRTGERVALVEDVFNNFQNTDNTLSGIGAYGVEVALLAGALNRSPVYDSEYRPQTGRYRGQQFPVVAAIREAYPEYEQSDPEVAADIARGNLEIEVKKNWGRLTAAMQAA